MNTVKILLVSLFGIACLCFIYGILKACIISWKKNPDLSEMPAFLASLVSSIAAILATNLGAILGINANQGQASPYAQAEVWNPANLFSSAGPTVFQTIACYLYVLGLLAAAVTWAWKSFSTEPNEVVPIIAELTKSLIGVIIGALAISLNVPQS